MTMIAIPAAFERTVWAVFGLCMGSFVNVLIYRLPREMSVVRPRSRCPHCSKPIAFYDNLPLLSWILLKGRCRGCRAPISARYPAVELLLGLLALGLRLRWPEHMLWTLPALLGCSALVAVAFIDWDTFLIPDELSLGLLAAGLLAAPLNPLLGGQVWWSRILHSLGGGAVGFALCWGLAVFGEKVFKKEAMGGGDVKLLAAIGAWAGALGAFNALIVASFLGSAWGLSLILRRRIARQDPIPFGPFLSAAALLNFYAVLPPGFPFTLF